MQEEAVAIWAEGAPGPWMPCDVVYSGRAYVEVPYTSVQPYEATHAFRLVCAGACDQTPVKSAARKRRREVDTPSRCKRPHVLRPCADDILEFVAQCVQ